MHVVVVVVGLWLLCRRAVSLSLVSLGARWAKCASPYFHFFIFSSLVFIVIVIVSYRHTMPLATRITKMLNIEHPVVMGGMTGTGTPELAAAVSNAGGLGLFAVLNAGTPEKCRAWIKLMPTLTDKPW